MITSIIFFGILSITFSVVVQLIATSTSKEKYIHYIEGVDAGFYVSVCCKRIPLDNKNITNKVSLTTCPECLKKISLR
jgi:hypothetical protein